MPGHSENWRSRRAAIDELIVIRQWSPDQAEEWLDAVIRTGKVHPRIRHRGGAVGQQRFTFTLIEIDMAEVSRLLAGAPAPLNPLMPTGLPGRPSKGKPLILAEFGRRIAERVCKPSLREEASELLRWFGETHRDAQQPANKTIENIIRPEYRKWKAHKG